MTNQPTADKGGDELKDGEDTQQQATGQGTDSAPDKKSDDAAPTADK